MSECDYEFSLGVKPSDSKSPVLIVGNIKHLKLLRYDDIKVKLQNVVTKEVFNLAVQNLQPHPTDVCSLYVNHISIAALQDNITHYNSSAQPHLLTKIVKSFAGRTSILNIVVVCDKKDAFASGCAVVRAFPLFTRKTCRNDNGRTKVSKGSFSLEFLLVSQNEIFVSSMDYAGVDVKNVTKTLADVAHGIQLTARIVDSPCNEMNVDDFINEIKIVAKTLNIIPMIVRGEELKEKGFGGIYGVGAAAEVPPALVVLSHFVPNAAETIAWVGKGIVYDTGGLCIKGRTDMPGMKRDCGGAAAVLGAFYAIVRRGFVQNLHAIFCLAENAVGPRATKPDDIHTLYSGRTVEINNTDAEGRLVLADGVAYAQKNLNANIILDMATLTGAQSVCTGKYHSAVLSNCREWEQLTVLSGQLAGDLAFPIPYCPELHFNEFTSVVADMKNSCADRTNALSSCAGLFVIAHLGFDTPIKWVHVDIAGVSYSEERATGYGVALLTIMFGHYTKDDHLQYLCSLRCIDEFDSNSLKHKKMRMN